ncbi:hypothetical protein [Burkholderia cenocepacia]|uniref:hypothetical protein n=1 Tax=Burkholderia cenocepacia TaxID=95486 RepID=UPI002938E5A0|nr:hypothetical protein [Burkholderia cenocepacia]MDV3102905.1 hypothetical protein [Burkholderia cenocepacia]
MKIIREPVDGWMIRMNDEVGKRVVPGSVFRFGRVTSLNDGRPLVEILQPGWTRGLRYFDPFNDEAGVRAFLVGLGFTERPRVTPGDGTPLWDFDADEKA